MDWFPDLDKLWDGGNLDVRPVIPESPSPEAILRDSSSEFNGSPMPARISHKRPYERKSHKFILVTPSDWEEKERKRVARMSNSFMTRVEEITRYLLRNEYSYMYPGRCAATNDEFSLTLYQDGQHVHINIDMDPPTSMSCIKAKVRRAVEAGDRVILLLCTRDTPVCGILEMALASKRSVYTSHENIYRAVMV